LMNHDMIFDVKSHVFFALERTGAILGVGDGVGAIAIH
jgi:hypothetical protein